MELLCAGTHISQSTYVCFYKVNRFSQLTCRVSSRNFTLGRKLTNHMAIGHSEGEASCAKREAKMLTTLKYPKLVLNYSLWRLHVTTFGQQRGGGGSWVSLGGS